MDEIFLFPERNLHKTTQQHFYISQEVLWIS